MLENSSSNRAIIIIRWITILPLAILGSWLVMMLVYYWGMILGYIGLGFNKESLIGQYYFNSAPHIALGVTYVYIGAVIAPNHQKMIAFLLACIGLVLCGFSLYPYMIRNSGWEIWNIICTIIGIILAVSYVYKRDIDFLN